MVSIFLAAFLASQAFAIIPNSHRLHEKRSDVPLGWSRGSKVDASRLLPLRVGLTQQNLEKGPELLLNV